MLCCVVLCCVILRHILSPIVQMDTSTTYLSVEDGERTGPWGFCSTRWSVARLTVDIVLSFSHV